MSSRLARTPCRIDRDIPALAVHAQESQLVRVIVNVVNNALDVLASIDDPCIVFSCRMADDQVSLIVGDNGPGVPESVRARLFQPFFSTKPAGQGLGLGLAMSREVMREMDGDLRLAAPTDGGATFELVLPKAVEA